MTLVLIFPLLITNNNRQSVTCDFDYMLAMLLESSKNGILELTQIPVPTTTQTVSVIRRDAKHNTSRLTAPGSLNTCSMCEGQRWIFNGPAILLWYTGPPSLGLDPKDPAILGLKAFWKILFTLTQLGLNLPTAWLTVQASSNWATLTPLHSRKIASPVISPLLVDKAIPTYPRRHLFTFSAHCLKA